LQAALQAKQLQSVALREVIRGVICVIEVRAEMRFRSRQDGG